MEQAMQRKTAEIPIAVALQDQRWLIIARRSNPAFRPPTDVIELGDRLLVRVEIAGMRSSDFNITLHDRVLLVTGTREQPPQTSPAYHQAEIGYGEFRVEVTLPWSVERERVSASYEVGFLQVELPRLAGKQIPVRDVNELETDSGQ
jgi:HSP20 family protein